MIRPHIALITNVAPVHLGHFANLDEIAAAKAEIFTGLERGGIAVLNRDNAYFDLLSDQARRHRCERIIGFGVDERADARLKDADLDDAGSSVRAEILGFDVAYRIGAPGRHLIVNSLAALAVVAAARGDVALGAREFEDMEPPEGRGRRYPLDVSRGQAMVIDESYNANPASMRAALEVLGAIKLKEHGRRIAVLGDMLELGGQAPELHAALAGPIERARVDKVFVCGPHMSHLWDVLPDAVKGVYARTSSDLAGIVKSELKTGDVMMIKGSLGAKMGLLVDAVTGRRKNQKEGA
jgi:UDP-N-acetylmuramoyl-tripeptide--D-alanyl-D-alanine ligase